MPAYEFAVKVRTQYLPEQSNPERDQFVFSYTITIQNTGSDTNSGASAIRLDGE